ncbi:MAG: glycosyltransferase [Methylococcaceae bacterium]
MTSKNLPSVEFFFVGTAISQGLCESLEACSVAGNKFQLNVVTGLGNISNINVITVQPFTMYPKGKKIWVKANLCDLNEHIKALLIPFINIPVFKQISITISIFFALVYKLWKNRSSKCIVIVYNVFSPFSIPTLIASKLFGCKCAAIIADLPFDDYDFKGWRGFLQRIDFYVQIHIISKFNGIIALTQKIIEDFAPLIPSIVIEGGIEIVKEPIEYRNPEKSNNFICLYSGALNEINGISLLLASFSLITNPNFRLWIFGHGPLASLIINAAATDKRIVYWGQLSNDQVKKHQREAAVLINPRPSNNKITYYTFPSKLIEYMLSGRPVITTKLSGISKDYYEHLIFLEKETPENLANLINNIYVSDPDVINEKCFKAEDFIRTKKNWHYQSQLIYDFLITL